MSEDGDRYMERMEKYEALPVDKRLEKYREEIRGAEKSILKITGDPYDYLLFRKLDSEDKMDTVEHFLGNRRYALEKMFAIHCSDLEVARIEELNSLLLNLSHQMFHRTANFYRHLLTMTVEEKDDDIEVSGTLNYSCDGKGDILRLEDDGFYASDFQRIIPIIEFIEEEHRGGLAIMECYARWRKDCGHSPSMTDRELGLEDTMDDGDTWADGWLFHPRLDHIVICYATHALVTHCNYSIPDFIRLNSFEVRVEMKIQQFSEQDGSRLWWWRSCGEQQFIDKFLHEAEHRPEGISLGEFIYNRGIEYFDIDINDEANRKALERLAKFEKESPGKPRMEHLCSQQSKLPDCRQDDSLIVPFLRKLYEMQK